MSDWHGWTPDEEIVLVWFLSCGIKTSAVRKLIAYKCGTAQHDERDMKRHVFDLHHDSQRDTWNGFGPLLVPLRRKKPRPSARIPKIRAIDWKYNWGEYNVDDWLIQKTWRSEHLQTLTFVGENEEALIRHVSLDDALIPELANEV